MTTVTDPTKLDDLLQAERRLRELRDQREAASQKILEIETNDNLAAGDLQREFSVANNYLALLDSKIARLERSLVAEREALFWEVANQAGDASGAALKLEAAAKDEFIKRYADVFDDPAPAFKYSRLRGLIPNAASELSRPDSRGSIPHLLAVHQKTAEFLTRLDEFRAVLENYNKKGLSK